MEEEYAYCLPHKIHCTCFLPPGLIGTFSKNCHTSDLCLETGFTGDGFDCSPSSIDDSSEDEDFASFVTLILCNILE